MLFRSVARPLYRHRDQGTEKKRVVEVIRKITWGAGEQAQELLQRTVGCKEFNTSIPLHFNGTMRERLASLTRKCRHAAHRLETLETGMYLIGCTYKGSAYPILNSVR